MPPRAYFYHPQLPKKKFGWKLTSNSFHQKKLRSFDEGIQALSMPGWTSCSDVRSKRVKDRIFEAWLTLSWKFLPHSCIATLGSGLHGGREPKIDGSDTTTGQFSGRLLWGSSASAEFAISSPPLSTDENQIQSDLTIWKCTQISLFKTVYWAGKQSYIFQVL